MTSNRLAPRIAVFTHDTFGLGHVRRSSHIVRALSQKAPDAAILLITGSPALHIFQDRPQNVDCIKIPTIATTGSGQALPPHLPIDRKAIGFKNCVVKTDEIEADDFRCRSKFVKECTSIVLFE